MKISRLTSFLYLIFFLTSASNAAPMHGISMFGDLKYDKDFAHFDYVNPDAPKGGEVTIAAIGTFDNLNPYILKGVAAEGLELTYDTLLTNSADETFSEYGLIAESIEVAEDRGSVIFNLRKEAKWHDGSAITSSDVVFSFNTIKEKGHPYYKSYYAEISKAEEINDQRVKFTFKNSGNRELPLIIGQLPIISKAYYQNNDFTKTTLNPPITSGPYKVLKVEAGRSISYQRYEDYWAKDLPVNKGRYNFDQINIDYYRDATVAVEALKAGEYDFRRENISKTWANAYNIEQIKDGRMIKEELVDGTPTGMQCFAFNTRRSNFKNPKIREALSYAYDFEWANKQLFFSAYARNSSFFGNSEFGATGLPSAAELKLLNQFKDKLPDRLFNKIYTPPTTEGDGNSRPNLIKAQQLLDEAGWPLVNMKRINPETGEQVKIEFLIASPAFERVIAPFIRNLKKLGIEGTIRSVDSSQYIKRREEFDFDIIVNWFTQGPSPGNEQLDYWHSSRADKKGSRNLIGIKNPAVDFMVNKIINAKNKDELITATRALDRILLWNFYVIPQWYSRSHRVIYWNKFGRPEVVAPYSLGFIDSWWIDPKKEEKLKEIK
ncbi:extracellular solute-binding protein [Rickettsiales bacterium]|nr:extracellular solute-binding protein [Rickettsiales bacterium]